VEEVKVSLKPVYQKKEISKDEYKEIMRRAVPKVRLFQQLCPIDKIAWNPGLTRFSFILQICHHKSGEINPSKIQGLVQKYIKQVKHERKKASRKTK
jgi:PHD and RING finger domain-containing protein 1